jgi:pantoate--beta-alanine ligase
MGALHEGHGSLMSLARTAVGAGPVVVSIFVNPMQFGAGEDLTRYPRTLSEDLALCEDRGVDLVYAPEVQDVYPAGEPEVMVDPGALGDLLEGRSRPGHFRGVLTVVAKLFGLVRPNVAVFGEKDYQQLALVRRMVADLCLGVEVIGAPTERETDGLAMSSRNRFLTPEQRMRAAVLNRALRAAGAAAAEGADPQSALLVAHTEISATVGVEIDYLTITDPDLNVLPVEVAAGTRGRILVAAKLGSTRLIDNLPIAFG